MAETWRVVLASGEVLGVATPRGTRGDATRVAIARNCALWHWPVAEILAPGELTRAELRAQVEAYAAQLAPMTRAVDALRAAAVAAGHPAADGDPDAQLCAVRAAAWSAGAEAMRAVAVAMCHRVEDHHGPDPMRRGWPAQVGAGDCRVNIEKLPVPPCPWGVCCGTGEVPR